jgi:hypothetical protein
MGANSEKKILLSDFVKSQLHKMKKKKQEEENSLVTIFHFCLSRFPICANIVDYFAWSIVV